MKNIFRFYLLMLIVLLTGFSGYSQTYLKARLTPEQLTTNADTTNGASAAEGYVGTGAFILDNDELHYILTITSGNKNDTTGTDTSAVLRAVHLHMGAIGDTGNVVAMLGEDIQGNTISGIWSGTSPDPLTDELRQALVRGMIYVIAITDSGEIRGQIDPASGTGFAAHLTGPQETDSVVTDASGTGSFLLTDIGLVYLITVQGIEISAAHFHRAIPGMPGGVVKPIEFNGHTAMGIWTPDDANNPLTTDMKEALLIEELYVNVHSPEYPAGEIRGQVLHAGGFGFSSPLASAEADTGNTTDISFAAVGNGSYVLTDAGLVIHINVNSSDSVINAYLTNNMNQNLKTIDSFRVGTFSDVWFTNGDDNPNPLTDENISDLLEGNISLVVETLSDTLRGQLTLHKQTNFSAILTGLQERPQVLTQASGLGHFVLNDDGLSYYITVQGLDTISAAHFHLAPIGVPGGVVEPISFDSNYVASGTWSRADLDDEMLNALLEGNIYVNVHTPEHPAGEIRGQVLPGSGTDFKAHLTGKQEVPKVENTTMGTGNFILTNEGLIYKITVDSLNITAAHFHLAPLGVPGGVVKAITDEFMDTTGSSGNTAVGVWRRSGDTQPLTDSLLLSLLAGDIYVNVHTPDNPPGEVRGQVLPNGGTGFVTVFDTSTNNTNSPGNPLGTAVYTLTDAGLLFDAALNISSISSASINLGQAGQTGSIVHDITGDFDGSAAKGVWLMLNDTASSENLSALFTNGLFLNVQTPEFPISDLSGTITRAFDSPIVSVSDKNQIPEGFTLEQNYPNPFNPSTIIKFSIPERGMVSLSIYNVIGEKVATLVNGQMNSGTYEVEFNAANLASGVYFYRLNHANTISTKKMILIK